MFNQLDKYIYIYIYVLHLAYPRYATRIFLGTLERYVRGAKYRNMLSPYFAPSIRHYLRHSSFYYRALSFPRRVILAHTRLAIRKHLPWKLVESSDC